MLSPMGVVFLCLASPQSPDPGWLPVPLSSQQHPAPTAPSHSSPTPTSPLPSRTPGAFQLEVSISSWSWAGCLPWLLESRSPQDGSPGSDPSVTVTNLGLLLRVALSTKPGREQREF